MQEKNDKKITRSWAFFDWANSAYNLVITSTIFPAYYVAVTTTKNSVDGMDYVTFFGKQFINSSLYSYAMAVAFLVIAIISPILSAIADARGNKKVFMKMFTYVGALSCCGLYFFDANNLELGVILFCVAAIGFWGSLVFYNSYLPEISSIDQQDKLSAKGYTYGYIGSVILQIICFVFVFFPNAFGLSGEAQASRLSFFLVGIWWIVFAQIPFKNLPNGKPSTHSVGKNVFTAGFIELKLVWQQVTKMNYLKWFLLAYFFYSMGVQTVMLVATLFGDKVIHLSTVKLIATILILQIVAIPGAMLMSYFSKNHFGNVKVLICVVMIWIGGCVYAYFIETEMQFYLLAGVVGLIMGGIQSLSRSTYSKFLPLETKDHTSFFSFYDVTEKIALVIGLFSFGYIEKLTGNMRNSVIALTGFFILGLIFLLLLKKAEPKTLKAN